MSVLCDLQSQPPSTKKAILWGVVIVLSALLMAIWIQEAKNRIKNAPASFPEIKMPPLDLPTMPQPEIEISPEIQKQLEELEKQSNEEIKTN